MVDLLPKAVLRLEFVQTSVALSGGAGGAIASRPAHAANRRSDRCTFASISGDSPNHRAPGRTTSGTANCTPTGRRRLSGLRNCKRRDCAEQDRDKSKKGETRHSAAPFLMRLPEMELCHRSRGLDVDQLKRCDTTHGI